MTQNVNNALILTLCASEAAGVFGAGGVRISTNLGEYRYFLNFRPIINQQRNE